MYLPHIKNPITNQWTIVEMFTRSNKQTFQISKYEISLWMWVQQSTHIKCSGINQVDGQKSLYIQDIFMLLHIFLMQLDGMYLGAYLMKCYISVGCVNVIYKHGFVQKVLQSLLDITWRIWQSNSETISTELPEVRITHYE